MKLHLVQNRTDLNIFCRKIPIGKSNVDEGKQVFFRELLRERLLNFPQYPPIARHLNQQRIYFTQRWTYEVQTCLKTSTSLSPSLQTVRETELRTKSIETLRLYLSNILLKFVAIDIHRHLPKVPEENGCVLATTDGYSRMTKDLWTSRNSSLQVKKDLIDQWIVLFAAAAILLPENAPRIVSIFLQSVSTHSGNKSAITNWLYTQTNGHVERFNGTILTFERHHAAKNLRNWDSLIHSHTHVYGTPIHCSSNTLLFRIVLSRNFYDLLHLTASSIVSEDRWEAASPQTMRAKIQLRIAAIRWKSVEHRSEAQECYKCAYAIRVCKTPLSKSMASVFIDEDPLRSTNDSNAENNLMQTYIEVQLRELGPFKKRYRTITNINNRRTRNTTYSAY